MAEVFKAKSYGVEGFEKVVVIKRILPELAQSDPFVAMFIHEAKLAVRLSHANVVQVFDLGLAPGTVTGGMPSPDAYYMAMEYVSGLDLATLLSRCRRQSVSIPVVLAVYIAAEVAKGLDHAHRRRDEQNQPLDIVHLDVSPQNVLLSLEGEVKVTDFGIAKAVGALEKSSSAADDTQTRQLKGKFGYMSPEHAEGAPVDARSDLFSLGTVLYEMLAGVNPFNAPTSFETLRRVSTVEYPPVELLRPDVPSELVALLKTAMAPRREDRFADAGRMYEALLAFLYGFLSAQGRRFSAHDLAAFLVEFRTKDESGQHVVLDAETVPAQELTPIEVPAAHRLRHSSVAHFAVTDPLSTAATAASSAGLIDRASARGERREVTALVVELPGRDDPTLVERAAQTLARYGGRIVERELEHVAALFGTGDPDGRDTETATRCALVLLRGFAGVRQPSAGIHVGRIHVSGTDGVPSEGEPLSSLIATARGLSRAREGMCALSAPATRQVRDLFVFEALGAGASRAPGLSPSTMLVVSDVRGTRDPFGRFVGRKDELRAISDALASVTRRKASALTVRGDRGVGKTRLLFEVERRIRKGGYNVGWHIATCLPRGVDSPLSGIQCMLHVLCGVAEGDPDARVRQVVPRLRALGLHDDEVGAVLVALGAPAGFAHSNAKASLVNAFARMVVRLSEDRPHAFVWDEAHCMDPTSFGVLEAVLLRVPQARALFLFAARPAFSHPLEQTSGHSTFALDDLDLEDGEALVRACLGTQSPVPIELMSFIRQRAGGHPLMIEELVKALVEARAVTLGGELHVTTKLASQELALPKTLRGLVASRVARLAATPKAVLQAAAVLGEPVHTAVLSQITGVELAELETSLSALRAAVFLVSAGDHEPVFVSPIVREVVVDALTTEAAREIHLAAAQALEGVLGPQAVEQASRIAAHLYAAGQREQAGTWFARSGERRIASGQLESATRDFARAIELCDLELRDSRELAGWFARLAGAVHLVRALPEAALLCDRVIARMDASHASAPVVLNGVPVDSLELRVRVRIDAGRILGALHQFDAARAHFASAEAIAQQRRELVKSSLVAAAELSGRQGDFKRSLALFERLQTVTTAGGDKLEEHKILVGLVHTNAAMGDHASAMRHFDRATALLPSEPTLVCEHLKLRALIDYFARDFRPAAARCEQATDLARELGLNYEVAVGLHNLGDILIHTLDYARAYGAIKQSLAFCDELGHDRLASHNRMFLAFLDGLAGDTEADRVLVQGIRYAESNEFTWDMLDGRRLRAKLFASLGETERARVEFLKLRELARAAGNRFIADDCDSALRSAEVPALRVTA